MSTIQNQATDGATRHGVARMRSMEFNSLREKALQSRFSRCLELYGEYKGIYGLERSYRCGQTSSFPISLANSVYGRYRRCGERCVHRIIPADSSSCDGTDRFQASQILSKNLKTDIDCYACFPLTTAYHSADDTLKILFYRIIRVQNYVYDIQQYFIFYFLKNKVSLLKINIYLLLLCSVSILCIIHSF